MPASALRLFVAVHPPEAVAVEMLAALDAALRGRPDLAHRATPAGQVHLTLQFLGDVPGRDVGSVTESVARSASGVGAFELAPQRLIVLPNRGPARLVAAETDAPGAIREIKQRLVTRLAHHPRPRSGRAFLPHLTLARFRAPRRVESLADALAIAPFPVEVIRLMRSVLRPSGAEHIVLEAFPLDP